jgi:predicted NUDIX family phosphoesterase
MIIKQKNQLLIFMNKKSSFIIMRKNSEVIKDAKFKQMIDYLIVMLITLFFEKTKDDKEKFDMI